MMKYKTAFAPLVLSASCAHGDTYTYMCKVKGRGLPLKIDDARHELRWSGKTYKTTDLTAGEQQECPRFGWKATRPGETFNFCTATQGMAQFKQNGTMVQCDQKL